MALKAHVGRSILLLPACAGALPLELGRYRRRERNQDSSGTAYKWNTHLQVECTVLCLYTRCAGCGDNNPAGRVPGARFFHHVTRHCTVYAHVQDFHSLSKLTHQSILCMLLTHHAVSFQSFLTCLSQKTWSCPCYFALAATRPRTLRGPSPRWESLGPCPAG